MKIVIAPDSFKESLDALQVAEAIEAGLRDVFGDAQYCKTPIADGGEGTTQTMIDALGGDWREISATGPNGDIVEARYGLVDGGDLAVIEMAAASGLELVPPEHRTPLTATSRGTGEMIRDALDQGVSRMIVGIGGSATNDAGSGMISALGARLLDADGCELSPGGAELRRLARLDLEGLDPRLKDCRIETACDVTNPLTGPNGASAIFGPQKGATAEMVEILDAGLAQFASIVARDLGKDVANVPGAGAAGGLGAALTAVCGASLRSGCEIVFEALDLERRLVDADLVITGEGRTDGQTAQGKAPIGVAAIASKHDVPVVILSGALTDSAAAVLDHGVAAVFSAVPGPCTLDDALRNAPANLRRAARNIAAAIQLGTQLQRN